MTTETDTAAAFGEAIIAEMNAGDLEDVLARMHPELEVHEPESLPYGGKWTGREGFTELLTKIMGLADLAITDCTAHETADGFILVMDLSFTSQATGKVLRTRVVEIDRLEGGLIREIDVYYKDVKATVEFFAET